MAAAGGLAVREAERLRRRRDRRDGALARGVQGLDRAVRRAPARAAPAARPAGRRRAAARAARRQPGRREPRRLRPRPGPVHAALRAAGDRRRRRRRRVRPRRDRARAAGGHRQPARLSRRRRRALAAATSTASRCRCRSTTSRSRSASSRRSPSAASTRCCRRATPSCRRSSRRAPASPPGLMIAQYAAAALVNECQVLSHPAGAGSIPTSAGQEDFNSMGALAALKARTVVENAAHVVATELVCAVPGARVPPPAAQHGRARARARRRCARTCRASRRTARSPASWRSWQRRCAAGS